MKTLNSITSAHWQPSLGKTGEIVEGLFDLHQAIFIILRTPLGSDPHRPLFGCKIYDYLDHPVNRVTPYLVRETVDALNRWEPRIVVADVVVLISSEQVALTVFWQAVDGVTQNTEVIYERSNRT